MGISFNPSHAAAYRPLFQDMANKPNSSITLIDAGLEDGSSIHNSAIPLGKWDLFLENISTTFQKIFGTADSLKDAFHMGKIEKVSSTSQTATTHTMTSSDFVFYELQECESKIATVIVRKKGEKTFHELCRAELKTALGSESLCLLKYIQEAFNKKIENPKEAMQLNSTIAQIALDENRKNVAQLDSEITKLKQNIQIAKTKLVTELVSKTNNTLQAIYKMIPGLGDRKLTELTEVIALLNDQRSSEAQDNNYSEEVLLKIIQKKIFEAKKKLHETVALRKEIQNQPDVVRWENRLKQIKLQQELEAALDYVSYSSSPGLDE